MLLDAEGLPTADLSQASTAAFTVAASGEQIVGVVAVEKHGRHGLLRSLVVDPRWRGARLGRALVEAAEQSARSDGIATLTLLTQTAAPLFRALGYRAVSRDSAPPSVQGSAEFAELCPSSCTCMCKAIGPDSI